MRNLLFVIMASFCQINASLYSHQYDEFLEQEKILIDSKDLIVTDEGIYFLESGILSQVDAVFPCSKGVYVVKSQNGPSSIGNKCPNEHQIYHYRYLGGCDGCANWICPFRCKCHSPWTEE